MIDIKESVTSKFQKFEIYSEVDEHIKDFVETLNKSNHISTKHSCEGHTLHDNAYFMFAVDGQGWDLFFNKVLPEISYSLQFKKDLFNDGTIQYFNAQWHLSIQDDEYNSAITISCTLLNYRFNDFVYFSWEENKALFWKIVIDTFLKYY
jgi:hypothetical protein